MKKIVSIVLSFTLLFTLFGCSNSKYTKFSKSFLNLFDTASSITAYDTSQAEFDKKYNKLYGEIKGYSELYDIYNDYDNIVNLKYINDNAYKKPVKVDKRIIELLTYGKKAYKITNGYVDIAMGSVLSIWHDYREKGESLPPKSMLTKASEHTDINNLIIDKENSTIFFNDKRIIELLTYGKKAYKITNGYVDIAMGSVLSIWHDYREKGESLPPKSMLTKASEHTDINNLIIDKENSTIFFNDKELKLDVGAITKGFVCNKIYEYITKNNVWQSAVISLGGNIITIGNKPDKNDFVIGIENPNSNEYLDKIYADDNTSVVTSGSYQRYYTVDGKDYCHIIDKNTLYPANYFKSVTVISSDSALADTLSTALFCMDLNTGRKLAEKYNIQAIWFDKNDKITKTDGVKSAK